MFQKLRLEALVEARLVVAHDAGQKPDHRVEQHHRGDLAAGQHIVADRDFAQAPPLDDPLVDALEAAADDQRPLARRERADEILGQRPATRAHQQARTQIALIARRIDRIGEDVGAQHHSGAAAGRRIVHRPVAAAAEVADLPGLDDGVAALQRPARQRHAEGARKHLRIERQDGSAEGHQPSGSALPASISFRSRSITVTAESASCQAAMWAERPWVASASRLSHSS